MSEAIVAGSTVGFLKRWILFFGLLASFIIFGLQLWVFIYHVVSLVDGSAAKQAEDNKGYIYFHGEQPTIGHFIFEGALWFLSAALSMTAVFGFLKWRRKGSPGRILRTYSILWISLLAFLLGYLIWWDLRRDLFPQSGWGCCVVACVFSLPLFAYAWLERRWVRWIPTILAVGVVAVGGVGAWFVIETRNARRDIEALKQIGDCHFHHHCCWLTTFLPSEYLRPLKSIVANGAVTPNQLELICRQSYLERLVVRGVEMTDEAIPRIAALQRLTDLQVYSHSCSDVGVAPLLRLPKLKWLHCNSPLITDQTIKQILLQADWEGLGFEGTKISGDALAKLQTLPKLETLGVSGSQFSQVLAAALPKFPRLVGLNIDFESMDDAVVDSGSVRLPPLSLLRRLSVNWALPKPGWFPSLANAPKLEYLDISGLALPREVADEIAALPRGYVFVHGFLLVSEDSAYLFEKMGKKRMRAPPSIEKRREKKEEAF